MLSNRVRAVLSMCFGFALVIALGLFLGTSNADAAAASSGSQEKELAPAKYETTAYYLNVRADASAKSKILKVVKRGTILSVVEKLENGWLKLEGKGYVHGGYAEPVGEPAAAKKTAAVRTVAATSMTAKSEPHKPFDKVQSPSGLTAEAIEALFKGTGLANQGLEKAIMELEDQYGINAYFTIAVMKLESGNGTSKVAKTRNNLFGLNSNNGTGYLRFKTKVDSVKRFGQLISKNYIGKGYTTIEKIGRKYCPANSKWPGLVKNVINRDYKRVLSSRE
ncbi:glucosaminidase domain-containing protein [Cohnella xylanilytica]|uniref:Glucosaminidase domain-containing protein n=1 Tax=Cohnella xylanilytica TaxID=557555 RepID=A0A841U759_9BACL|nr:glucosaminidase domain-containing protein [Cohnella xylanilytica]MBB6693904.1 glucosaminidase domain-containing protein [Cohnella xylanilytica]